MSSIAQKLRFGNTTVCTTLYLDEVIVEKLLEPEKFLSKPETGTCPEHISKYSNRMAKNIRFNFAAARFLRRSNVKPT